MSYLKLEDSIEKSIASLREATSLDKRSSELVSALEEGVLGKWGMIDKQANVMRIRGRSRGRGSFVEHLAEKSRQILSLGHLQSQKTPHFTHCLPTRPCPNK